MRCSWSDFIVASLQDGWNGLTLAQQQATDLLQLKVDNEPESSGVRTQFLKRMVELANQMGQPIPLLYYPPYLVSTTRLSGVGAL